ncbi:MAG: hypothetical protein MRZ84_02055 [Eubacterium sp.]|nr:hypothetical protein [Eubacterium sp.]
MSLSISAFGGYSSFYPAYSASTVSPVKAVDRVDSKLQSAKTEPNASVKKVNVKHAPDENMWTVPMKQMFPSRHRDILVLKIQPQR